MFEINTMTTFLGWCSIINMGILMLSALILIFIRDPIISIHSRLMGLTQDSLPELYFQYLGFYKIAIIIFNLVPYIALKIMN